jgi:hypothetical protein
MSAIMHFYFVPKQTTTEEVNAAFTQQFMHIHLDDGTLLVRKMKYEGRKIDPEDEQLAIILEDLAKDPDAKQTIQDFLNDV